MCKKYYILHKDLSPLPAYLYIYAPPYGYKCYTTASEQYNYKTLFFIQNINSGALNKKGLANDNG